MGADARKKAWALGQRVGILLFRHACGTCVNCRATGDVRFCKVRNMAGLANDGGMAEYIVGDADNCVLLPDEISYEQAAPLMCAGVRTPPIIPVAWLILNRRQRGLL
jgi:D-arabinose 1-dehydrogenase-like Zn-dependent alcohol dehydrogenase